MNVESMSSLLFVVITALTFSASESFQITSLNNLNYSSCSTELYGGGPSSPLVPCDFLDARFVNCEDPAEIDNIGNNTRVGVFIYRFSFIHYLYRKSVHTSDLETALYPKSMLLVKFSPALNVPVRGDSREKLNVSSELLF